MKRFSLALMMFFALNGCAKPDAASDTLSPAVLKSQAEAAFGELSTAKDGACSVVYLGTEKDVQNLWNKGKGQHFALTAAHCVDGQSNVAGLKIHWPKVSGSSTVRNILLTGSGATFDDFVVLAIDAIPAGIRPFHPALFRQESANANFQITGLQIVTPWKGLRVFLLASRDGKLLQTECTVSNPKVGETGFHMKCDMTNAEAPGLSGGLVVTERGDPVGIFKNTINAADKQYGAHALASGRLGHMYWPSWMWWDNWWGKTAPAIDETQCRPRLAKALGLYPDPSQGEVDAFLANNRELAQSRCEAWVEGGQDGKTNREICGFGSKAGEALFEHMRTVLGKNNSRGCNLPEGATCRWSKDSQRCDQNTNRCKAEKEGGDCCPVTGGDF